MRQLKYQFIDNMDIAKLAKSTFSTQYPIILDIETEQLYKNLVLVQLYQPETSEFVYLLKINKPEKETQTILAIREDLKDFEVVAHRGIYDFGFFRLQPKTTHDTKILLRLAFPEWNKQHHKPYSLGFAVKKLLGNDIYKKYGIDKEGFAKAKYKVDEPLTEDMINYACLDVILTHKIFNHPKVKKWHNHFLYKLNCKSLKINSYIPYNGLWCKIKDVEREIKKLDIDIAKNENILNGINPNSPKQCLEALGIPTGQYREELRQVTRQGKRTKEMIEYEIYVPKENTINTNLEFTRTDKPVLLELIAVGSKLAKAIFDQRRLLKARTMLESYKANPVTLRLSKCISFIDPLGAYSGRMSASGGDLDWGINSQQIPRKYQYLFMKGLKIPKDNGKFLKTAIVHADYSTAEIRAGASIMNEKRMAKALKEGIDIHKLTASVVSGKPIDKITKEERQNSKAINFGLLFGMGLDTFIEYAYVNYGVTFSREEAEDAINKYFKAYPAIKKYHSRIWDTYEKEFIYNPFGLRSKANIGTEAINFSVQSAIADATKISVVRLAEKYPEAKDYIVNIIHDAIEMRVPNSKAKVWAKRLAYAMKYGWQQIEKTKMFKIKGIPMPVEVEINKYDKTETEVITY